MTYREFYAQNASKCFPPDRVHMITCPNSIEFIKKADPNCECPYRDMPGEKYHCKDCWDREMPDGCVSVPDPTPEKLSDGKPTARILVEAIGDTIHMEADGDMEDLVLSVLAAVYGVAKDVFDSAESKLAAEKIIYGFQLALNPLAKARSLNHE